MESEAARHKLGREDLALSHRTGPNVIASLVEPLRTDKFVRGMGWMDNLCVMLLCIMHWNISTLSVSEC